MAQKPRRLKVVYSDEAAEALQRIWNWTATNFGISQANSYTDFLRRKTDMLATKYLSAPTVDTKPEYRYFTIKRRRRGHGHLAVYQIHENTVEILTFYHTAQDWRAKLDRGDL